MEKDAHAVPPRESTRFHLLVITAPWSIPREQPLLRGLIAAGLYRLHLRKPDLDPGALSAYLNYFTANEKRRIVVHCNDRLLAKTGIAGLHLPFGDLQEEGLPPTHAVSTSIHSWQEYADLPQQTAYAFIGPVYDSLSKPGYRRNNRSWKLPSRRSVPLMALGGIHRQNIGPVLRAGFNGAALLGSIWKQPEKAVSAFLAVKEQVKRLSDEK